MNNLSVLKPSFLFFLIFMLHLITVVTSAPCYTTTDNTALDCGHSWTRYKNSKLDGGGSAAGFLIVLSLLCCMVILKPSGCCWWSDPNEGKSSTTAASSLLHQQCRQFSLAEIKSATNKFDPELIIGKGGYGDVFKGVIKRLNSTDNGSLTVAIKRLNSESSQGAREFMAELEMLSQLRHEHLVSLTGYCHEKKEMILVYDYMSNGTLRDHLYDTKNEPLTWKKRLEICKGAAIGVHYLHAGLKHKIVHRDLKSTNILLDDNWTAKVSDFGLSKLDRKANLVKTKVRGTYGYLDPEYARGHPLTEKSDVYSFGVVLFEVLCARKVVDKKLGEHQANLANWARRCINNGTSYEIVDPYLKGKIAPECFKVFLEIADSCVNDEGIKRPAMNDVMERLICALELQEQADAEMETIYPGGGYMYPEISIPVAQSDIVDGGTGMDSSISYMSTTLDTISIGTSFPQYSATVSSETSNSKEH